MFILKSTHEAYVQYIIDTIRGNLRAKPEQPYLEHVEGASDITLEILNLIKDNALKEKQINNLSKQLAEAKRRDGKGRFVSSKEGDFLTR